MVFLARFDADTGENCRPEQGRARAGRRRRVLYAVGPGDVAGQYRDLQSGLGVPFQLAMSFTQQFVDECDLSGIETHLISSHARRDDVRIDPHRMENLPRPALYYGGGLRHHLGMAIYGFRILVRALRERPAAVLADSGTTHWVMLAPLALFRIPVIAVLHNALWPMGHPPRRAVDRLLRWTDGWFFRHVAAATVGVSPECVRQVRQIGRTLKGPIFECRAQYRTDFLDRVPPAERARHPFRVLFLGRVEEYKGVFLLLDVAELLERDLPGSFAWRIVGPGEAFNELQRRIAARGLGGIVQAEKPLSGEQAALETLAWADAMVVPTTSQFKEGLAMTAAESVLAGRPVVVSSVVPAAEVLGNAVLTAETDNAASFVAAFRKLALDPRAYAACQRATADVQAQFYDRAQGLGSVLMRVLAALR